MNASREELFVRCFMAALVGTASTSFDPPDAIARRAETIAWAALDRLDAIPGTFERPQLPAAVRG